VNGAGGLANSQPLGLPPGVLAVLQFLVAVATPRVSGVPIDAGEWHHPWGHPRGRDLIIKVS
jgi:hypothetical protein